MMRRILAFLAAAALLLALPGGAWAADGDDASASGADAQNVVDTGQLPDSSFVYDVSISDLAQADSYLESRTVQITGEVVGDIIRDERDDGYRWITVAALPGQAEASIQVRVTEDQAAKVGKLGRYQVTGDTVSVMGEFHLVCGQHDGLSDLHAASLTVTRSGNVHRVHFDVGDFAPAVLLVLLGGGFFLLYRRKREELR